MTFLLIGMTYCQMLGEDVKNKIPYPKSEVWGKIPSWAHSMVYAAEIFQLYKNDTVVTFSAYDFFNALKEYMNNNMENANANVNVNANVNSNTNANSNTNVNVSYQECFSEFNDNYNPECVAFFANNSKYTFSARLNGANVDIVLKDYKVLDLKTYADLQDALNTYLVLYNGMHYDKTIINTGNIYEKNKNISNYNSTCLVIGTIETEYAVYSEIIHPYSIYSGTDPYFIQTIISFGEDKNDIKLLDYNHLYDKSIGLVFDYVEEKKNDETDKVDKGYKAATITLGVISGILIAAGATFAVLCTKFKHLFQHGNNGENVGV